jgi:hypothetical protein
LVAAKARRHGSSPSGKLCLRKFRAARELRVLVRVPELLYGCPQPCPRLLQLNFGREAGAAHLRLELDCGELWS